MTRFSFRGFTILALTNFVLAALFNKLLVRIDHYRDEVTDVILRREYKLINRLEYKNEI